jgi:hypothetical protein
VIAHAPDLDQVPDVLLTDVDKIAAQIASAVEA